MNKKNNINQDNQKRKRIADILAGTINSISVPFALQSGEEAYYLFQTTRMADNKNAISYTKGITKQKGVLKRSIIGGLLFGRTGAVIGGLSGTRETNATTTHHALNEQIDKGTMIMTNMRLYFVGSQIVSIPYSKIVSIHFPHYSAMKLQYPGKIKGESYVLSDREAIAYYKGIMRKIGKDKSAVKDTDIDNIMLRDRVIIPINSDDSIDCPSCGQKVKEYRERWGFFSKTREYTCQYCGHITLK